MLAYIPSPDQGVWHLGPLPLRAYALCIIVGAIAAIWIGERRFTARGGRAGAIGDVAIWAIPFGIVGARLYHVITDHQLYFGEDRNVVDALKIWEGGLGIWGAVAGGALGALIACKVYKISYSAVAGAVAPGLLVAQAIGRVGNYFNQELYGKPTELPWGLEISAENRPEQLAWVEAFHPTFLYELLWNLAAAVLIIAIDRKFKLSGGRLFALYVMAYTAGRVWIEDLRIDPANEIGPFRLNVWTSIVAFLIALVFFLLSARRGRSVQAEPQAGVDEAAESQADIDAESNDDGPENSSATATSA